MTEVVGRIKSVHEPPRAAVGVEPIDESIANVMVRPCACPVCVRVRVLACLSACVRLCVTAFLCLKIVLRASVCACAVSKGGAACWPHAFAMAMWMAMAIDRVVPA